MKTDNEKQVDKRLYNIHHELEQLHKTLKGLNHLLTESDDKFKFTRSEKGLWRIHEDLEKLNKTASFISFWVFILAASTIYKMWF